MRYRVRCFSCFGNEFIPAEFWSRDKAVKEFDLAVSLVHLKEVRLEKIKWFSDNVEIDHWVNPTQYHLV